MLGGVEDVEEEPAALAVEAGAAPGEADVLAGESRHNAIHCSTPASSVEGSHVGPDRRWSQTAFRHASRQDRAGEGFPFNVADADILAAHVSSCCGDAFSKHADARTEFNASEGTKSHTRPPYGSTRQMRNAMPPMVM